MKTTIYIRYYIVYSYYIVNLKVKLSVKLSLTASCSRKAAPADGSSSCSRRLSDSRAVFRRLPNNAPCA